uniref:phytanoyl-CoA dioxygenase family protein n=2 Tax=Yoonia sp. TaxID=2212373 RepID=UPI0040479D62|tara:strand:- start:62407 stop:63549 length:1143 start_codon:yes stop_codon:yes gene_type:complete
MTAYFDPDACDLAAFKGLTARTLSSSDVPLAADIQDNAPIYDVSKLDDHLADPKLRRILMAEWAQGLRGGAGIVVLQTAYADCAPIDAATRVYNDVIAAEKLADAGGADHFAAAGNNDRVWNSLQKLCLREPATFAAYFANPAIDAVCEAWLGPNYQMTAQVNLVRPGGGAQLAHRDYHLGFQTAGTSAQYPAHVHDLSPVLTLQGAVAHSDMPVESGPTKLLPFSQTYAAGYAAWRRDDFRAYFEESYVQLPLSKGDVLFFSPALFHAAGANTSKDVHRMANLLQVSSPFGRAMESIDRVAMCKAVYPEVAKLQSARRHAAIAACAEGYAFPTNLDRDPPVGGLAPQSQAALFHAALEAGWSAAEFAEALDAQTARRRA